MRPANLLLSLLLLLLAGPGCYFYGPPKTPKITRPILEEGERVKVRTWSEEYFSRRRIEFVTNHYVQAKVGDRVLTQGEFRSLADPDFDKKIARLERKRATCKLSLVPSTIGAVVLLAGTYIAAYGANQLGEERARQVMIGAGAAGGAAFLVSYPMGGYACRPGANLYRELRLHQAKERSISYWRGNDEIVSEMHELAQSFNQRFRTQQRAAKPAPADAEADD